MPQTTEKTIPDIIHVWRYNGIPEEKIIMDLSEYSSGLSEKKLLAYAKNYSESVRKTSRKDDRMRPDFIIHPITSN